MSFDQKLTCSLFLLYFSVIKIILKGTARIFQ